MGQIAGLFLEHSVTKETDMDELEAMLGKPDWKPSEKKWEMPKRVGKKPDALVLVNLVATCRCGEKFVTPNKRVMLRFGHSLLGIGKEMWRNEYNGLPREVEEVEDEVLACPRCFGDTSFGIADFS